MNVFGPGTFLVLGDSGQIFHSQQLNEGGPLILSDWMPEGNGVTGGVSISFANNYFVVVAKTSFPFSV